MSNLTLASSPVPTIDAMGLEELLNVLTKYGKVRTNYMGDGWVTAIDMYVTSVGAEFKVSSDFRMVSSMAATRQCYDRVIKTLSDLKAPK
jgi:hypothetical protein